MKKLILLSSILLILSGPLPAQEILTLEQCRQMALVQNKQIAAAAWQSESARHTAASYKALFFPDFTLNGMGAYSTASGSLMFPGGNLPVFLPDAATGALQPKGYAYFPGIDIQYDVDWAYTGGITVKQPLYMGGKIRAAHKMAVLGKDLSVLNERLTETEVMVQTDKAYIGMVKAQEIKKVAESYHATLSELMRNIKSAYQHGMKPQNDVLKVQVKLNEATLNVHKANNALRLASMNLCHYIGKPLITSLQVDEDLPVIEDNILLQTEDISLRPEYKMLNKQVELNRQQVKLSRSEMLPQIGIQGNYSYLNGLNVNNQKFFDNASFTALLNVSIPLFHFGERKHKVNAAKAKLQQSILEQADQNELMQLELTQAANNLEEAFLECNLADTSLEQAEENRRISAEQYKLGLETLSDHLEAQTLWQQAYQTKVEAHFQLYLEWVTYQKASGTLPMPVQK